MAITDFRSPDEPISRSPDHPILPHPPFLSHFVSFFLKPNARYFMSKRNKLNHKLFKLCRQTETGPPRPWSWSLSGWLSALQVELGASGGPLLGNVSKRSYSAKI